MSLATTRKQNLAAFWDEYAFTVGEVDFLQIDVALGAMAHGDWAGFERRLAEGLACAARADAESLAPDEDAVDEAATAFRYDRDLIAASDLAAWLEAARVSTDDWMAMMRRAVLRERWAPTIEGVLDRFGPSPRRLEAAAVTEGVCSGCFETFQRSFAGRVAAVFEADAAALQEFTATLEPAAMRLARQHAHWLALRPEADTRPRLGRVMHIEERFRALAERVVSRDSLRAIIEAKGPDWVMLELETLAFSSEHGAREAVLCVREDGLSLYDVAALSHQPLQRAGVLVEEVPEAHRSRLLSAQLGQVQGPLSVGDRFEVSMVVTRTAATLENGRAVERARLQAVDDLTRRASREHVRRHRES